MAKLKTFYRTFVKSLTKPAYYKDILSAKFSFSLKYLALLLFLISLFSTFKLAINFISLKPKLPEFADTLKKVIVDIYPDKLVVTHKGGKISTNVEEPYFIDMPESGKSWKTGSRHFFAIDTKGTVEEFEKYDSVILLTDEFAVMPDNQNQQNGYKIYPLKDWLKDVPEGAFINKAIYQELVIRILPVIDVLPRYLTIAAIFIILLAPFFVMSVALSGYMLYLLFLTLVLWIIAKTMKKDLSYGKTYQLSLHGLTLPILISSLISLFGKAFPFLFSAIFLVFMIVVIKELPSKIDKSN